MVVVRATEEKGSTDVAKKRANGEGNIRKRKDGRWEGRYTAGYDEKDWKTANQERPRQNAGGGKRETGKSGCGSGNCRCASADEYTIGTWLQTWYELYAKPHLRFSTAEYYRHGIELHIVPRIGDIPLKKLTGRDLQGVVQGLAGTWSASRSAEGESSQGLSDSTIRGITRCCTTRSTEAVKGTPDRAQSGRRLRPAENFKV